eukprot:SAG22_NODE_4038_length_1413_cov_1.021309_2_plen_76_part_00
MLARLFVVACVVLLLVDSASAQACQSWQSSAKVSWPIDVCKFGGATPLAYVHAWFAHMLSALHLPWRWSADPGCF